MRALTVSLLVAGAIAASLTLAKRQPERRAEADLEPSPGAAAPLAELDAIRTAGL